MPIRKLLVAVAVTIACGVRVPHSNPTDAGAPATDACSAMSRCATSLGFEFEFESVEACASELGTLTCDDTEAFLTCVRDLPCGDDILSYASSIDRCWERERCRE